MRISTQLAVFFIAFNAFAGMLVGMGVADDLGLNMETGNPQQIEDATKNKCQEQSDSNTDIEVCLGNSVGGTLFGMYNQVTQQAGKIFYSIAPGFAMLKNFLPNAIVDPFSTIAALFIIVDLLSYARGFNL